MESCPGITYNPRLWFKIRSVLAIRKRKTRGKDRPQKECLGNVHEITNENPAGYNAYINHGDLFGGSSLPRVLDHPWPEYLNCFSSCRTIARRGNQFGGLKVDPLTNDAPEAAEELMRQAYARLPHHFSSTKRTAMRSLQSGVSTASTDFERCDRRLPRAPRIPRA